MRSIRARLSSGTFTALPPSLRSGLDPESLRLARLLNILLTLLIAVSLLVFLNVLFSENPTADAITATLLLGFVLLARWLLFRGRIHVSAVFLTSGLWLTLVAATFVNQFEGNGPLVGLVLIVVIAGLLLGSGAGFLVAFLNTIASLVYLALTQSQTVLLPVLVPYSPLGYVVTLGIVFFATAGLIYLVTSSLNEALQMAKRNEQAMAESNRELEVMRQSLQDQVAERTYVLEQRTNYLQAAIEVSRATASILDVQTLIQTSVDLIRDAFRLYYVGLFQLDPTGEWAVLQAGTGDPGKAMLARRHRIRYGQGMVGWSIANAQPRVASNVGEDTIRLNTPELPDTHSEAAIPLRSRGRVLGALTVQSKRPGAFGEMEITIFQSLADQLAIALDNAHLISESQEAMQEAQRAYGRISHNAWLELLDSLDYQNLTYRYGMVEARSAEQAMSASGSAHSTRVELQQARQSVFQSGKPTQVNLTGRPALLLPIPVRDQVIGVASFVKEPKSEISTPPSNGQGSENHSDITQPNAWNNEEVELLEAIIEQLGLALDSARLYAETRQRAEQERLVDQVTSQMRATLDIDAVLETAARELRDALGLAEVEVRLGNGASDHDQ